MASLLETTLQTILKDIDELKSFENQKEKRKQTSLIKMRINSAMKLAVSEPAILDNLEQALKKINL